MENTGQRKLLIRNAIVLILLFAAVLLFRWNCLSDGGSRFAGIEEETTSETLEFLEETPKYMVGIGLNEEKYTTGVIIGFSEKIYILCDQISLKDISSVKVTFTDYSVYPAVIEKVDPERNIGILSILKEDVDLETRKILENAEFGNSDSLMIDDNIAIVGNEIIYGKVSDVSQSLQIMDGQIRVINTDIQYNGQGTAFLISSGGKVVGIVDSTNKGQAYGISDILSMVDIIIRGSDITYLGIYGVAQSIDTEGVLITQVVENSPAWKAGLRKDDVIYNVESKKVTTMKDIQTELEKKNKEEEIILETKNLGEISIVLGGR